MTDFSLPIEQPRGARSTQTLGGLLAAQLHVLHALVLHDIKGRFFGNGLGYVVTILWPGAHIAIIVIAHAVMHREMPYGDSALVYASTGVLPYIAWNYISRFTMTGVMQNKPFLQYPIITVLDIMMARQFLEIVSTTIVTTGLILVIIICHANPMPEHPDQAALALLSAVLLGMGFGVLNATICTVFPMWTLGYIVIIISFYFTSGVIINPESLPSYIGDMLAWNPLLHCVEWMRSAYYDDYPIRLLDRRYPFEAAAATMSLGLVLERTVRHFR